MIDTLPLGLSTYSLGTPLRPSGLEALAEAGFSCIEYAFLFYHPDVEPSALGLGVGAAAQQAGLDVWSVHAPLDEGTDIASLDETARRYAVERMIHTLDLAEACGAKWVVVHCSHPLNREEQRHSARNQSLRSLNELFKRASQRGVGLAIENNPAPFVASNVAEIAWMLQMIDGEVGLCLDTGHANLTGQLDSILNTLCANIVTLHLHDNDGQDDDHWLPGIGTIDWQQVAGALQGCDYNGPLMCELAPSVVAQMQDLKAIAEAVRAAFSHREPWPSVSDNA